VATADGVRVLACHAVAAFNSLARPEVPRQLFVVVLEPPVCVWTVLIMPFCDRDET
jgi:hypothetical protein